MDDTRQNRLQDTVKLGERGNVSGSALSSAVKWKSPVLLVLGLSITLVLSGCGYHLRGFADTLPPDIETIALIPFENETYETDLETFLSQSLAEEFSKARRLKVVPEEEADVVLTGVIKSYTNRPVSFAASDVAREYRTEVAVDVTLKRRPGGEVIWKGKGLREVKDYTADPEDVDLTETNEREARRQVAEELAELIYDRVFEGF